MRRRTLKTVGFVLGAVGATLLPTAVSAGPSATCNVDLETLSPGEIVTELSVGAGISGCSENSVIQVSSQNCKFSSEAAIVFDSSCAPTPTSICEPYDQDIGTPHEDFGGPGIGDGGGSGSMFANDEALGNVLVLAKDKVDDYDNMTGFAPPDGLVDDPDDADCNGYYIFDFSDFHPHGVTIDSVTMLDIEEAEGETPAQIFLTKSHGPPDSISIEDTGNGGKVEIGPIGAEHVVEMKVEFKGSGALGGFSFNPPKLERACWATFGGFNNAFIGPEGLKVATFGGNVGPPPSGHLNVVHHELGQHLTVADVEVVDCIRDVSLCPSVDGNGPGQPGGNKGFDINVLNFAGMGMLDGTTMVPVWGQIVDCGEPQGKQDNDPDQFMIYVGDDGNGNNNGTPFVGGPLDGGNAQLHPPVPNN